MMGPHKTIDAILTVLDKRQAQIDVYTTTTIMQQVTDTSAVSTYMSLSSMAPLEHCCCISLPRVYIKRPASPDQADIGLHTAGVGRVVVNNPLPLDALTRLSKGNGYDVRAMQCEIWTVLRGLTYD